MSASTALLTHERLAEASERLAPLPAAANRLTAMLGDDDVDVRAIVDIVTYDPVLTAILLGQANSAHSGYVRATSTVSEAVVRLGLGAVAAIAMRTAVAQSLRQSLPVYGLEGDEVFAHSIKTAVAAEVLRSLCPTRIPAATPTIALLHDVGKIIISDVLGSRALELVGKLTDVEGLSLIDAELAVFGLHHAQAGVHAIRRWKLPLSFVEAVGNHHSAAGRGSALAEAVRVADVLAHAIDQGTDSLSAGGGRRFDATTALYELDIHSWSHGQVLSDIEKRYEWVQGMMAA